MEYKFYYSKCHIPPHPRNDHTVNISTSHRANTTRLKKSVFLWYRAIGLHMRFISFMSGRFVIEFADFLIRGLRVYLGPQFRAKSFIHINYCTSKNNRNLKVSKQPEMFSYVSSVTPDFTRRRCHKP